MKSVLSLWLLLFSFYAAGQPAENPRVKPFLDKFQKSMEEIRKIEAANPPNKTVACKIHADNAMTAIGHIKKRDPNYDVASLEAQVKPYIEAQQKAVEAHNTRVAAGSFHSGSSPYSCSSLFSATTTTEFRQAGNLEEDIRQHIQVLKEYEERVEVLLRDYRDGVEACLPHIRNTADGSIMLIAKYKKEAETYDEKGAKAAYRELVGEHTYWNAARRIYPDLPQAAEVYRLASEALAALGSMEQVVAKAASRRMERLKNTFMPAAVVKNAALEAEFREAFAAEGWGETIVKIHILSRDWSVLRNNLTGVILGRIQTAAICAKKKSGECILYEYTIRQDHTGGGYSGTSRRHSHGIIEAEFLCENAK